MLKVDQAKDRVSFAVRVQPRASKSELCGLHGEALKVRLSAPPVDGAANEALLKLLAKSLKMPKSSLELVGGQKSRLKRIQVRGLSASELVQRLGL